MLKNQFDYMTISEVMDQLDVSRSTIDRWRKNKQLPSLKIGKEIYFDKNEVKRWYREWSQLRTGSSASRPALSISIGYTSVSAHMWNPIVIKEFGLLEQELARIRPLDRLDIKWHRFKDGVELLKEMMAGHIHIATFGDYAMSVGHLLSRLLPGFRPVLLAAGGKSANGEGFGLVVPNGVTLTEIAELAALPIATTFRTNAGYRLGKLLEAHRLPKLNIIHRSIEDSMESLRQGRLGASIMWEPYLSVVHHQKIGKSLFHRELGSGFIAGVTAEESWALAHEDFIVAYLKAHLRASRLLRKESYLAADIISRETGFALEAVSRAISRIRWDAALYGSDLKQLSFFDPSACLGLAAPAENEGIPHNLKYLRIAAQELNLPVPPPTPIDGDWREPIHY